MSIFFKAKGTPSVGLFLIRLTVGIYTLALGISQANHIEGYISKVKAMNMLSENTAFIVGFAAPFLLIIFGAMYIMGFFTPITSFVLALITFIKILATGFFQSGVPFNKDIIFLVCFLLTLFAGAGMISFDAILDRKKKSPPPVIAHPPIENKNIVTAEVVSETKAEIPPPPPPPVIEPENKHD
jgi:uncharacterized membrane protein YphA (DoxX/SURF4 family)